jgi:hypothetical protein
MCCCGWHLVDCTATKALDQLYEILHAETIAALNMALSMTPTEHMHLSGSWHRRAQPCMQMLQVLFSFFFLLNVIIFGNLIGQIAGLVIDLDRYARFEQLFAQGLSQKLLNVMSTNEHGRVRFVPAAMRTHLVPAECGHVRANRWHPECSGQRDLPEQACTAVGASWPRGQAQEL